jgi:parallel beta-helix repeat protein
MNPSKPPRSTGIRIEDSTDGEVTGNYVEGYDEGIVVTGSKRIRVAANTVVRRLKDQPRWVKALGIAALVATVISAVVALVQLA